MASNRGPNAVAPDGHSDDAYYKSREQAHNAFSWAKEAGHHTTGGVGGSWASASAAAQARQPSYHEQHSATPSITVNSVPGASVNRGAGGTALSDGSYEKNLIEELCPPGGMKPVPPPDKLSTFAKSVPNLNADLICPVLLDCLEEGQPWIKRAKALCVMETCIQYGTRPDNTNPYANFFYTCREEIMPLASHARAAIKDPARRVLKLMSIDPGAEPAAAAPLAAATPAPAVNLLDFDDDDNAPPAPAPASMPPAPPPTAPPPPPAEHASSQGSSSLFGGMQVKNGASAAQSPATAPAPPPPAPTSGNLLDGLDINDNISNKPAEKVTNMFDSLTVKSKDSEEENKKVDDEDEGLASIGASGSAFAFMNNTSAASKEATPSAAPDRSSFDPLSNFSPNTARQMMQFSPEQMQAMTYQQQAYQQQMMMQQQMQMMMMMQQQGGGMRSPMPMQQMQMPGVKAGVMGPHGGNASSGFSFLDKPAVKKDDHKFDFVMDSMKSEKSHK